MWRIFEANIFIHFVVVAFLVAAFSKEILLHPTNGLLIRREQVETYLQMIVSLLELLIYISLYLQKSHHHGFGRNRDFLPDIQFVNFR